jgi:hypothetical protein
MPDAPDMLDSHRRNNPVDMHPVRLLIPVERFRKYCTLGKVDISSDVSYRMKGSIQ